jgi:hypothetical protein
MATQISFSNLATKIKGFQVENATSNKGKPFIDIVTDPAQGAFKSPNALFCDVKIYGSDSTTAISVTKPVTTFKNVVANSAADHHVIQPSAEHQAKYGPYDKNRKYKPTCLTSPAPELDTNGNTIEHRTFASIRDELTKLGMHGVASSFGLTPDSPNEHEAFIFCSRVITELLDDYINQMAAALYNKESPNYNKAKEIFGGPAAKDFRGNYLSKVKDTVIKNPKAYMDFKYNGEGVDRKIVTIVKLRIPSNKGRSGFGSTSAGITKFIDPKGQHTTLSYKTFPYFLNPFGSLYSGVGRFQLLRMQFGFVFKYVVTDIEKTPAPAYANAHLERCDLDAELDDTMLEQFNSGFSNPLQLEDEQINSLGESIEAVQLSPPITFNTGQRAVNQYDGVL